MFRSRGAVTTAAVLALGVFAFGCGGGASDDELEQARQEGAKEAREKAQIDALEAKVKKLQKQGKKAGGNSNANSGGSGVNASGATPAGGPISSCTGGVQVGSNTSCSFAMNVAGEYGSNPGASTISAYSPVTGQHYTMSCSGWSGGGTVCRGGNGASVFLP